MKKVLVHYKNEIVSEFYILVTKPCNCIKHLAVVLNLLKVSLGSADPNLPQAKSVNPVLEMKVLGLFE